MIVVAIIGILSAIALPMYSDYVLRGRIPDATSNLSALAVRMEQAFQDNKSYRSGTTTDCAVDASKIQSKSFDFSCDAKTASSAFKLTATGKAATMKDFEFTLNEKGEKTSKGKTGWTTGTNCWITSKSGC